METDFERVQFRRSAQRHSWPPKQDADYTIDPYSMTSYISRLRKEHDLHLVDKWSAFNDAYLYIYLGS